MKAGEQPLQQMGRMPVELQEEWRCSWPRPPTGPGVCISFVEDGMVDLVELKEMAEQEPRCRGKAFLRSRAFLGGPCFEE